jgi:hypothetical protein
MRLPLLRLPLSGEEKEGVMNLNSVKKSFLKSKI